MVAARALLACILLASLVPGCLEGPGGAADADAPEETGQEGLQADADDGSPAAADQEPPEQGNTSPASTEGPAATAQATACPAPTGGHGQPRRDDGAVTTVSETGGYIARRTVAIGNDFGGAGASDLLLRTFNGMIEAVASPDCDYHLVAELYGRGATAEDARQALGLLSLASKDDLAQGTLSLSFVVTSGPPSPGLLPVGLSNGVTNGAILRLSVPSAPAHDLEAQTIAASIAIEGLHGPRLQATTEAAMIAVQGSFDRSDLATSSAMITLEGTFNDVVANTSSAAIKADLTPTRSGRVQLSTSAAMIDVRLPRDLSAFDITADTSASGIHFDLEGQEMDEDDHATFRSADWAKAPVQVTLGLATSAAMIEVLD
jgi:hypothetical protein